MDWDLCVEDRAAKVGAGRPDAEGRVSLRLDGRELNVRLEPLGPNLVRIHTDSGPLDCHVVRRDDGTWVWHQGRARLVRPARGRGGAAGGQGGGGDVTPPMPAVVTKVLVAEGDTVAAGAALVVVSAMKMEMTLAAPHAGVVQRVRAAVGAKVQPGDRLVEIAPLRGEGEHDE